MTKRAVTKRVQFGTRMPKHLHAQIKKTAARTGVSINTEIVRRLEDSFSRDETISAVRDGVREVFAQFLGELAQSEQGPGGATAGTGKPAPLLPEPARRPASSGEQSC